MTTPCRYYVNKTITKSTNDFYSELRPMRHYSMQLGVYDINEKLNLMIRKHVYAKQMKRHFGIAITKRF